MPIDQGGVDVPALDQAVVQSGEARVEDVVEHLLNARRRSRARVEAAGDPQHPHVAALHETDRRIEVLLNFPPENLRFEPVVGILRPEAIGRILVGDAFVVAREAVGVEHHVSIAAQEIGSGQAHVHSRGAARERGSGIAARENGAHVRLLQEVLLDAPDRQVAGVRVRHVAGAHVEHADFSPADSPGQFGAVVDRHLLPPEQADLPAEERKHFGSGTGNAARRIDAGRGKVEDAGILQEERPFLGKEDGETREIDLPCIHFRLAEVGVRGDGQLETRGDVVEHVQSRLSGDRVAAGVRTRPEPRDERADIEAGALRQAFEIRDLARFGDLEELLFENVPPSSGSPPACAEWCD